MKASSDQPPVSETNRNEPLSLREAARLASVPREYLEECIAAGRLAVHIHHKGDATKFRVTHNLLIAAGILPQPAAPPAIDPNETLIQVLRDQSERLTAIEEQRFQLAGQLGAALERARMLEERMLALTAAAVTDDSFETPPEGRPDRPAGDASRTVAEPSTEPGPAAPVKLAVRISRLAPKPRWPSRSLNAIPAIRSRLLSGRKRSE